MISREHQVFISYSSKDSTIAMRLMKAIESKGIACWIAERDITPGGNYAAEIDDAIYSSKVFVVLISRHSIASQQVDKEISLAVNSNQIVLPFRLEDVELTGAFRYHLNNCQWTSLDSLHDASYEKAADIVAYNLAVAQGSHAELSESNDSASVSPNRSRLILPICIAAILVGLCVAGISVKSVLSKKSSNAIQNSSPDSDVASITYDEEKSDTIDINDNAEAVSNSTAGPDSDNTDSVSGSSDIVLPLLSQTMDLESIYYTLSTQYTELMSAEGDSISLGDYFDKYKDADIDGDGITDDILFLKDEKPVGEIHIMFSSLPELAIAGCTVDKELLAISGLYPIDIQWFNLNSDDSNEILLRQYTASTGGIYAWAALYYYDGNEWTVAYDFHEVEDMMDVQITPEGMVSLQDNGEKVGPFQYYDFKATEYSVIGNIVREKGTNKNLAKEYWPLENWRYDSGNYEEYDFTVTDEAIAELKEKLGITEYVYTEVGSIFYHEDRNVYLKKVTFNNYRDTDIGVYIDKSNNIIEFYQ